MICPNGIESQHNAGTKASTQCPQCLDYLNRCRLLIEPWEQSDGSFDIGKVQQIGAARIVEYLADMPFERISAQLALMEAMAAQVSLMKSQSIIKHRVPDPNAIKNGSREWQQAVKEQQKKQRPKAERKQMSDFERAVSGLTRLNVTREDAERIITEQFTKQGKVTK